MKCVICEQGELRKIYFKSNLKQAFLCEECGAVWFEGDDMKLTTPYTIQSLTLDDEMEYLFVDIVDNEDSDSRPVMFPKYK